MLIELRLKEAKILLDQENWDGAYYLVGYAVEFALKVRIIAQLKMSDAFPDKKMADSFFKHELTILRRLARLEEEMDNDFEISERWGVVKDWSEQSRYEYGKTEKQARGLYEAIVEGVLPWIKIRW